MSWVIVGLGNPGEEYEGTRHNAGRIVVEYFANSIGAPALKPDKKKFATSGGGFVGKTAVALVLPDAYMNKSGAAVAKFVKSAKAAERLVVVHDDLDIPLGKLKLSYDRGSGGHKGVESVARALKTTKFTRVRIGVSPSTASGALRKPEGKKVVNNFILTPFRAHEMEEMKRVCKRAAAALGCIVSEGRERAMNQFNSDV